MPGEYVIDAGRGKMYVYPPAGKMENWSVSLLEGPLMAIEHCKDVKVQGITSSMAGISVSIWRILIVL